MKKKIAMLGILVFLASCSTSDPDEGNPAPQPDQTSDNAEPEALSFAADIRPIFQSNCTNCHGDPPTQNAPMPLITLNEIMQAVDSRDLLGRINNSARPMPPTGLLPLQTRQLIQDWVDQDFPE